VDRRGDHRAAALDDASLLRGDLSDGGAEQMHVVEADAREDRQHGPRDVGGVEPSTEAGLEHGQIDSRPREMHERHRRQHLEPGRAAAAAPAGGPVHPLDRRDHQVEGPDEVGGGDRPAAHADAFLDRVDMRRQVAAHPVSGRLQHRGQHGDGRAFSLGAGDVDHGKLVVWIADGGQQPPHPSEAEGARRGGGRHRPLEVDAAVEPGQRRCPRVPLVP
jgi:hypothetical protein